MIGLGLSETKHMHLQSSKFYKTLEWKMVGMYLT